MASQSTRILIVDADTPAAQKIGLALDGAGFEVTWSSFSPTDLAEYLKDFRPTLLLVHAELASPQVATLLARLEATGGSAMPIVLLCRDVADEVFVKPMRGGVVEMFEEPFNPRLHVGRLRVLLAELPERPGQLRGRGGQAELAALTHHLMRTRRTGGLVVGAGEAGGTAFFVRGVLKSARYRDQRQQGALAALTRLAQPWAFTEGADGNAGLVEFEDDEAPPLVTTFGQGPASARRTPAPHDAPRPADLPELPPELQAVLAPAPQAPPPAASPVPRAPPVAPPPPAIDPDAARTPILFVDDDPAVVQMLSSYFSKKGYPVATAADGVEAMAQLVSRQFEVVIADLNMPRLDGWGLLRMVREDFRTHEVPIALFSAQENYRESLRLLHAGAQAYFPKTLRPSALEVQVRELVEPRRRFLRLVPTGGGIELDFSSLGPQWVLRALAGTGFTGQLDARDSWATWRLWIDGGRLAQATARMAQTTLTGDRALASFLASKGAQGTLATGSQLYDEGFGGHPTSATLARLVPWLNDEQARAREEQLAKARALTVHDELYRLYLTVGPPALMPIARLLCESRLSPAEVIARLQVTPMEVAVVVKDLLRRGVASLQG